MLQKIKDLLTNRIISYSEFMWRLKQAIDRELEESSVDMREVLYPKGH